MMTKGSYIELAAALRIDRLNIARRREDDPVGFERRGFDLAIETLCSQLRRDNPNFDKGRFMAAIEKP